MEATKTLRRPQLAICSEKVFRVANMERRKIKKAAMVWAMLSLAILGTFWRIRSNLGRLWPLRTPRCSILSIWATSCSFWRTQLWLDSLTSTQVASFCSSSQVCTNTLLITSLGRSLIASKQSYSLKCKIEPIVQIKRLLWSFSSRYAHLSRVLICQIDNFRPAIMPLQSSSTWCPKFST